MKLLISAIASVVFLAGCATTQENSNAANSSAPANQAATGNAQKATQRSSTSVTKTDGNPVEFTSQRERASNNRIVAHCLSIEYE